MSPYADAQAQRDYQRGWVAKRRADWLADKFCEHCQATSSLEVHHRVPSEKVHHAIWSWGAERRATELAKCVVLCRSCHQGVTAEWRREVALERNPHGTRNRYELGCECEPCREAKRDYNRAHPVRTWSPA